MRSSEAKIGTIEQLESSAIDEIAESNDIRLDTILISQNQQFSTPSSQATESALATELGTGFGLSLIHI